MAHHLQVNMNEIEIVIDQAPEFEAVATFPAPGGKTLSLPLKFLALGQREYRAWVSGAQGKREGDWLAEVVRGWGEGASIKNKAGEPVSFSVDALEDLCNAYTKAGMGIFISYSKALACAQEGNFAGPSGV